MGCNGGWLDNAWDYLEKKGIVTDQCFPYTAGGGRAPACNAACKTENKKYKCKKGTVQRFDGPDAIKNEVSTHGPIEVAFTVYNDFFNYKTGIYKHVSGGMAGGHAVKLVGYGVQGTTKYWICANSWNTSWGEQGFFRIEEGQCGIENGAYACEPDLDDFSIFLQ